jgi:diadenosine tetraphosphate (Ap4A) HIT family hydrolase
VPLDIERYVESVRSQRTCFICEIAAERDPRSHSLVYEDDDHIAFLNRFPTLFGYTLVAPREHVTDVTASFSMDAYVALQRVVWRVCEAVRLETGAERMYLLSLGSHQGNAHVHWHVAPLPPDTSYEMQQFEALRAENGVLQVPDEDQIAFASRVRERLQTDGNSRGP